MENYYLVTFIERFQKGDMSIFPTIFAEFEKLMYYFAARIREDDGFQELSVFLLELLYKINVDGFKKDQSDALARYIAVCIRNKYISISKRSDLISDKNNLFLDEIFEKNRISQQDFALTQSLKEVLCELPPKQRRIIFYKYIYNFSNIEIARHLKISPQAVNQIKNRAIKKLRELYLGDF